MIGAVLASFAPVAGQNFCGTLAPRQIPHLSPDEKTAYDRAEEDARQWLSTPSLHKTNTVVTIPVVIHLLYSDPSHNIPTSRTEAQMQILNEDFRKMNADTVNIPAVWAATMADCEIEFCLASFDPQGNPTDGILRIPTNVSPFIFGPDMKYDSTGGHDAWPSDQYLNIWVCDLVPNTGFAQFPGGNPETDGIVVGYRFFGPHNNPVFANNNQGRVATHEVGHWLGLRHIWGDDGGTCSGTDFVSDTPDQTSFHSGCSTFPTVDSCSPNAPGTMFMNYMDYTADSCMNSFTQGQKDRMLSFLNTDRAGLLTSSGCQVPVHQSPACSIQSTIFPNPSSGSFTLELKQSSASPLTITVFDTRGQLVRNLKFEDFQSGQIPLDLSSAAPGVYLISVRSASDLWIKRLVKE